MVHTCYMTRVVTFKSAIEGLTQVLASNTRHLPSLSGAVEEGKWGKAHPLTTGMTSDKPRGKYRSSLYLITVYLIICLHFTKDIS